MSYILETPITTNDAGSAGAADDAPPIGYKSDSTPFYVEVRGMGDNPPKTGGGGYTLETPTEPASIGERMGQGALDPIWGGAQLLTKSLPPEIVEKGNALNNWLAEKTGLVAKIPEGGIDQMTRERNNAYQASRGEDAHTFDPYRLGGSAIPSTLAAMATGGGSLLGTGLAARMATGALGGEVGGALTPVENDKPQDFWTDKGAQTGIAGVLGALVPGGSSVIGRMISPNASRDAGLSMLRREGVQPTIGQALGGAWNRIEEKLTSAPLVGDAIAGARQRARDSFNIAAINRSLAPIGHRVTQAGSEGVDAAHQALSRVYNQGKAMLGNFQLDTVAQGEMNNLRQMVTHLPAQMQRTFDTTWNRIRTDISPTNYLTGDGFKKVTSELTKQAENFRGGASAYERQLGDAFYEMGNTIEQAARRANGPAARILDAADTGWANLKRIEEAAKGAKLTGGNFTPGQLLAGVKALDTSVDKNFTARGRALMQDLASNAQRILGNKVPNSGTMDRLGVNALGAVATGQLGGYGIPAGLLAGSYAAYSSPVQRAMVGLLANRGSGRAAEALRQGLLSHSSIAAPAAGQLGAGMAQFY